MGDQIGQTGRLGPRERLGLSGLPRWLFGVGVVCWGVLFATLFLGILLGVYDILSRLPELRKPGINPADLRWSLLTLTALVAALGAVITLPVTLTRLHYTRRQTEDSRNQTILTEQGLITDRINNAVEALGTEKVVKVLGKDAEGKDITIEKTVPNMEVRIGAIHALARIARDNLNFHVQVMEILCAYIRENSPASSAVPLEMPEMPAEDVAHPTHAWAAWENKLRAALQYLEDQIKPRSDIQTALSVLGRRTPAQQAREAGFPDPNADGMFVFAEDFPTLPPDPKAGSDTDQAKQEQSRETIEKQVEVKREEFRTWPGYRLDLRETNLQGYDLGQLDLRGARFDRAQMQGANLRRTQMQGAYLRAAQMQGADLTDAQMQGADLHNAQMQGANLNDTQMQGADLYDAQMQGAFLFDVQMQGANGLDSVDLTGAWLFVADLSNTSITQTQIDASFGDAHVTLPPGLTRPDHWPPDTPD